MIFTFDQALKYFSYRLPDEKVTPRESLSVRCPFHMDRTASLGIKLSEAVWMCHAGCGSGGILDFERQMFPGGDLDSWWAKITQICGLEPNKRGTREFGKLIATYEYTDAAGKMLFQKLRYEPKNFSQRMPDTKGGWKYNLSGVDKPLYKLPELVVSQVAILVEGEKDVEALMSLDFDSASKNRKKPKVAATCNFDGAGPGKWKEAYSPYFAGRIAVVMTDNDEPGRILATEAARSIAKYAHSLKVVNLPVPEHGDVADFLIDHTVEDLMAVIRGTPKWAPAEVESVSKAFFVPPSKIVNGKSEVEWLVNGVIHRHGKGLFIAAPKSGKSMAALDLAVALASQQSWMGLPALSRPVKTAIVSREDGPGMTKRRVWQIGLGRSVSMDFMDDWLRFNTHEQSSTFSIESDADVAEITKWIKQESIEFCIFDVLNILHSADENSNTAMTKVMKRFDDIREATGVDMAVIHHDAKSSAPGAKKPRGASAIDSWWEWKVSVAPDPDNDEVKQIFFQSKATSPRPAIRVSFVDDGDALRVLPVVSGAGASQQSFYEKD